MESIAGNVEVEFASTRKKAVSATLALMLCMALFFCMGNASHLIDALVPMVIGINMLISGLALVAAFAYRNSVLPLDQGLYRFCLRFVVPIALGFILLGNLRAEWSDFDIAKTVRWGWLVGAFLIAGFLSLSEKKRLAVRLKGI